MRKALSKVIRKQVYDKYGGHCAYCGTKLTERFHVDHIQPVQTHWSAEARSRVNHLSNLMPSCASCNNFKSVFDLEQFRRELELQVERGRKHSVNFRMAERYGLIKVQRTSVRFFFEGGAS